MTMRPGAVSQVVLLAVAAALLLQLAPLAQERGTIAGVVVSMDTPPQPVRRAIVSVSGADIPSNISVVADDRGRFAVRNLAPGRYTVRASKAAHLTTTYGATRPGEPGTAVAIASGQTADIRIVLPRGAVISGTVRDHVGQPAAGVAVTIARSSELTGSVGYRSPSDSLVTDDRGMYRAFGLAPGEYVVSAVPRVPGSGDIYMLTSTEIDARLRALQAQTGTRTNVAAAPAPAIPQEEIGPVGGQGYDFAPTFYPGTTIAANAGRLKVAAGDVREGIDITLRPVRVARIEGTIVGDVDVTQLRPSLSAIGPSQPTVAAPRLNGPRPDGSFSIAGVTPGRYSLLVRAGRGAMTVISTGRGTSMSVNNTTDTPPLFAMQEVFVDGADITGLTLTLTPARTISGRIAFDAVTLTPPAKLAGVRVTLTTTEARQAAVMNGVLVGGGPPPAATVQPDGTFRITGVIPGTYGLSSAIPGATGSARWWLRSAIAGGRDILDHPFEIGSTSTDVSDVVLTFTDRRNELAGTLTSPDGAPASEYIVVVFPADESYWRPGARRLRSTRPASDGAFTVVDLPAGEYLIAALGEIDPDEWQRDDFLRQLVPAAVKVTIADGQTTRQDLRISR